MTCHWLSIHIVSNYKTNMANKRFACPYGKPIWWINDWFVSVISLYGGSTVGLSP